MFDDLKWREPARLFGNVIAALLAFAGSVGVLVSQVGDLLPEKYRGPVTAVGAGVATVGSGLAKVQSELIRRKVWSPESVLEAQKTALSLAGVDEPQTHKGA